MDWQQAKENTLRYWRRLRRSLDELDQVELLREINAVNDLCVKAKEQSQGEFGRCDYCLAFQQFGGCLGVSLRMSECVVEGRQDELQALIDQFIGRLEAIELPDTVDGPSI